jgi:predicted nucleic acid-binding protein
MTVVVADTIPLNYLLLIGEIAILPSLFGQVVIPPEVFTELTDGNAPAEVLRWIESRPAWLQVRHPRITQPDLALQHLDPGERAAILLAEQEPEVLLLIDDAAGRVEAQRRGIPSTGTLGLLRAAAIRGLTDLPVALQRLGETNFRMSRSLLADLLAEDAERKRHLDG